MRFERNSGLAFFLSALVALLAASDASAALLFQDRHAGANGEETIYRFEANAASTASPIEQAKAVKVATGWAAQYYGIGNLIVANGQERSMPIHFWLHLQRRANPKAEPITRLCCRMAPWLSRRFLVKT